MAHQLSRTCPHCQCKVEIVRDDTGETKLKGHRARSRRKHGWCFQGSGLAVALPEGAS